MFCGGSKSAKGGPNPLADMDRGGVQIRCDTGKESLYVHTSTEVATPTIT